MPKQTIFSPTHPATLLTFFQNPPLFYFAHNFTIRRVSFGRKNIVTNLTHGINTIIISPRRWGKTSTELQYNFMNAVANGVTQGFTRKNILKKYRLETSANVQAIKKSMISRDLIYTEDDGSSMFCDPILGLWIKRYGTTF